MNKAFIHSAPSKEELLASFNQMSKGLLPGHLGKTWKYHQRKLV